MCGFESDTYKTIKEKKYYFKFHDNVTIDIEQEHGTHHSHKFSFDMEALAMDYPPKVIDDGNKGVLSMNMISIVHFS